MTNGSEDVTTEFFFPGTKVNGGTAGVSFWLSRAISLMREAPVKSAELKKHFFASKDF